MDKSVRAFDKVREFHRVMDGSVPEKPKAYDLTLAENRAAFKIEEIVELLYATAQTEEDFNRGVVHLHAALDKAKEKVLAKKEDVPTLTGQVDALMDLLYFCYGSFVLLGVDPDPIFDLVHCANMGKIWPDGKAHHDPVTGKILKPENWERDFAPEREIQMELDRQIQDWGYRAPIELFLKSDLRHCQIYQNWSSQLNKWFGLPFKIEKVSKMEEDFMGSIG